MSIDKPKAEDLNQDKEHDTNQKVDLQAEIKNQIQRVLVAFSQLIVDKSLDRGGEHRLQGIKHDHQTTHHIIDAEILYAQILQDDTGGVE